MYCWSISSTTLYDKTFWRKFPIAPPVSTPQPKLPYQAHINNIGVPVSMNELIKMQSSMLENYHNPTLLASYRLFHVPVRKNENPFSRLGNNHGYILHSFKEEVSNVCLFYFHAETDKIMQIVWWVFYPSLKK